MIESITILSNDELKRIHNASLRILEDVGVKVYCDEGLSLLAKAGSNVDPRAKIARIPRTLVEEMISKAARCKRLFGRDPNHVLELGCGNTYIMTGSTAIRVVDLETGETRPSTKRDIEESAKVVDALENVHIYCGMVEALDHPSEVMRLERFEAAVSNTTKHIAIGLLGTKEARAIARMASAVAGGEEELRERPIVSQVECPVAPLIHYGPNVEAILEGARNGTPIMILSFGEGGMTAPVSIVGATAMANANGLAGLLMAWLVNPEVPLIYHVEVEPTLLKTMDAPLLGTGLIERGLSDMIGTQLARYYKFPNVSGLNIGDVVYGGIASLLFSASGILSTIAKPDIMYGSGGGVGTDIRCSLLSYEQMILGDDVAGMFLRLLKGVDASQEVLDRSIDLVNKVGPEGHFMRKESIDDLTKEIYLPKTIDNTEPARLKEAARMRARKILATHKVEPLHTEVKAQLRRVIDEEKK